MKSSKHNKDGKVRLRLDDLRVESFSPRGQSGDKGGVFGYDTAFGNTCTALCTYGTASEPTCPTCSSGCSSECY